MSTTQEEVFTICEELGESKVQARLDSGDWSKKDKVKHAQTWLRLRDEARNEASSLEHRRIARSAKNAGWAAAIAAIVAAIAAVIVVYSSFTQNG